MIPPDMSLDFSRFLLGLARVLSLVAGVATAGQAQPLDLELVHGERRVLVSQQDLARLTRATVTVDDHGTPATFEGVRLSEVLSLVGVEHGELLKGRALRKLVQVTGRDGYMVVLTLVDADQSWGDRRIVVADRRDGKPLPDAEGPWRLVVGMDAKLGRAVRQVTRIEVRAVP